MTVLTIETILKQIGWDAQDFTVNQHGTNIMVSLGPGLIGSTPTLGENAARSLVTILNYAGWSVTPSNWEHLLSGKESVVTRWAWTTKDVAHIRYGEDINRNRINSTGQWLHRKMQPANPGAHPLLWRAGEVDAALAAELELLQSGRRNPGNQTRGEFRRGRKRRV